MRVSHMTLSFSAKISMGNYESCDVFYSETIELAPGDDRELARALLTRRVKGVVEEHVLDLRRTSDARRAGATPQSSRRSDVETDERHARSRSRRRE